MDIMEILTGRWLEIAVGIYLICMVLYGHYKGFIKIAVSVLSLVITLLVVHVAIPHVSTYLEKNTGLYETIKESTLKASGLDEKLDEVTQTVGLAGKAAERSAIESLNLPEQIKNLLIENNNSEIYQQMGVDLFKDYVGNYLANMVIRLVVFAILFFAFSLLLHILIIWLDLIARLPIIHGMNKLAGAALGLAEALILLWVGCLLLTLFSTTGIGQSLMNQVENSVWLSWLYNHNMLFYMVIGIVKTVL